MMAKTLGLASLLAFALACGGSAPQLPEPAARASSPAASASVTAPPSAPARGVQDLGTVVPRDAGFVVELPDPAKLTSLLTEEQLTMIAAARPTVERAVAEKLGVDADLVGDVADAFEGGVVFGTTSALGFVTRIRDPKIAEAIVSSDAFEPSAGESAPGQRVVVRLRADPRVRLAWFPDMRLVVLGSSSAVIDDVERTSSRRDASFASSPRRLAYDPASLRVYADLASLTASLGGVRGLVDDGSFARLDTSASGEGLHSKLELSLVGSRLPALDDVFSPKTLGFAERLPEETAVFVALSTARRAGRSIRDAASELVRASGDSDQVRGTDRVDAAAKGALGLGLADLDALIGGEIVLGALSDPKKALQIDAFDERAIEDALAFAVIETRDDARARQLVSALAKLAKSSKAVTDDHRVSLAGGSLRIDPTKPKSVRMRIEARKGALLFGAGGSAWMDRLVRSVEKGERTLGATSLHRESKPLLAGPASALAWLDLDRFAAFTKGAGAPRVGRAAVGRALLGESNRGLDLTLEAGNGADMAVAGVVAALGIHGVRRYLAAAKTAEAKNAISAIARSAIAAFEREIAGSAGVVHKLCASAPAVPSAVPRGMKYMPLMRPGVDFETGDAARGWRCLKFEMTTPIYYQYEYRQGGPYKGPARGGPDPGPRGFEVSAEGDLDGDGKTSLFTRTGKIDPKTDSVVLSKDIFIVDEFE